MGRIGKMMEIILHTEQESTCNNPRAAPWEPIKSLAHSPEGAALLTLFYGATLGLGDIS